MEIEVEISDGLVQQNEAIAKVDVSKAVRYGSSIRLAVDVWLVLKWQPPAWMVHAGLHCVYRTGDTWAASTAPPNWVPRWYPQGAVINLTGLNFTPPCGSDVPDRETLYTF